MNRLYALLNIIIYYVSRVVIAIPVAIAYITLGIGAALYAYMIVEVLVVLGLLLLNWKYLKKCWSEYSYKFILFSIGGFIIYIVLSSLISLILSINGVEIPISENQLAVEEMFKIAPLLPVFVIVAISAPFTEELVFRSSVVYLIGGVNSFSKTKLAIFSLIVSLLIFMGIHVSTEIVGVLFGDTTMVEVLLVTYPYFILSSVMIVIFGYFKGNVFSSMTFHFMVNFIAACAMIAYYG